MEEKEEGRKKVMRERLDGAIRKGTQRGEEGVESGMKRLWHKHEIRRKDERHGKK